jgi:hypothetical protein
MYPDVNKYKCRVYNTFWAEKYYWFLMEKEGKIISDL